MLNLVFILFETMETGVDTGKPKISKNTKLLLGVLLLAAVLRLFALNSHDVADDEALIAQRAVGLFDYMELYTHLSPVMTFAQEQWWQKFSFHDIAPLGFWIEHLSLRVFGQNPWGIRLPFALAGIVSVYLTYLIGKRLWSEEFGLLSGLFLAILNYHVWVSRVGFMESLEIVFLLGGLYCFLLTFENQRFWPVAGLLFGAAILTKHLAVLFLPAILVLTAWQQRRAFAARWFYLGLLAGLSVISPLLIYNYNLFRAKGYFDSPLSSMLGMKPDVYIQTVGERVISGPSLSGFFSLAIGYHGIEILLALAGLLWLCLMLRKEPSRQLPYTFLLSLAASFLAFVALVPIKKHYLAVAAPIFAWLIAYFFVRFHARLAGSGRVLQYSGLVVCAVSIAAVSVNSQILPHPIGWEGVGYMHLRPIRAGYADLEAWLNSFYQNRTYQFSFYGKEPQVLAYQEKIAAASSHFAAPGERELVVYDSGFDFAAVRWLFIRRRLYEIRPIVISETFLDILEKEPPEAKASILEKFDAIYFIFNAPRQDQGRLGWATITPSSKAFLRRLVDHGLQPTMIVKNSAGKDEFWIFKLTDLALLDKI